MLNAVTNDFEVELRRILPDTAFPDDVDRYLDDPRRGSRGQAALVVRPETVEEVSAVLKQANRARVPIIPFGGGTGLVRGQLSSDNPAPVVVSLERMSAIRSVHKDEAVLVAEAGATLQAVQEAAAGAGHLFPLSIASQGTARIGGILATNAGGVQVLRYGNARDLCLGLEAVMADGSIWHGLKRLRKDNTGYDLRGLLVGSEGTLGVITAASLRLFPQPGDQVAALFAVRNPSTALELFNAAGRQFGAGLTAFELISGEGLKMMRSARLEFRDPLDDHADWMVLLEVSNPLGTGAQSEIENLFSVALDAGLVSDGVISNSEAQRRDLWHMRELIPEGNKRTGAVASHDLSLPLSKIPEFVSAASKIVAKFGAFRVNCFGHLGDGNLHYNIFPPAGFDRSAFLDTAPGITRALHDLVDDMGGSFSAEHGVGRLKLDELRRYGDPVKLSAMRAIKDALDPVGILNPGAVIERR